MAERPCLPLWTDAYLGDTGHLTTLEHGAYLLLLITMWRAGGSLPNDDKKLARFCRLTPGQWGRIRDTIMEFFTVDGDQIYQSRLTTELEAVRQKSKSQSRKAKAKWLKDKERADAAASSGQCRSDASPSPSPSNTPFNSPKGETNGHKQESLFPKQKQRASRLPEDWALPKAWGDWAVSEGLTESQARDQAARFRDFWLSKSGKDATKLDWQATWRNWIRNFKDRQGIAIRSAETDAERRARLRERIGIA